MALRRAWGGVAKRRGAALRNVRQQSCGRRRGKRAGRQVAPALEPHKGGRGKVGDDFVAAPRQVHLLPHVAVVLPHRTVQLGNKPHQLPHPRPLSVPVAARAGVDAAGVSELAACGRQSAPPGRAGDRCQPPLPLQGFPSCMASPRAVPSTPRPPGVDRHEAALVQHVDLSQRCHHARTHRRRHAWAAVGWLGREGQPRGCGGKGGKATV